MLTDLNSFREKHGKVFKYPRQSVRVFTLSARQGVGGCICGVQGMRAYVSVWQDVVELLCVWADIPVRSRVYECMCKDVGG